MSCLGIPVFLKLSLWKNSLIKITPLVIANCLITEYLANKSKVVPAYSAASVAHSTKMRRSGTNMFKAQRNRLVETNSTNEEKEVKKGSSAWLEIEREKNIMQEEKIKLEQERRRLEEEREKFEREKRQLQAEMARLKQ